MAGRLTRVAIKNYKSIASCDVELQPLTLLVGPNGSGKSNFLDALRFVSRSVTGSLESALSPGLLSHIRRVTRLDLAGSFGVSIECEMGRVNYSYKLTINRDPDNSGTITSERAQAGSDWFSFDSGALAHNLRSIPAAPVERTILSQLAGETPFSNLHNFLRGFTFPEPNPRKMRVPMPLGPGKRLSRDGSNAADVAARIQETHPEIMDRISGYLHSFNEDVVALRVLEMNEHRMLMFLPEENSARPVFNASQMSDGTLRAVGVLLALFQARSAPDGLTMVALEEPEANLHPGAAGVLLDALMEASAHVPVIASTHSADLLDRKDVPVESILAFAMQDGQTIVGPVDGGSREVLRRRLSTAGDLLRNDRLSPAVVA